MLEGVVPLPEEAPPLYDPVLPEIPVAPLFEVPASLACLDDPVPGFGFDEVFGAIGCALVPLPTRLLVTLVPDPRFPPETLVPFPLLVVPAF